MEIHANDKLKRLQSDILLTAAFYYQTTERMKERFKRFVNLRIKEFTEYLLILCLVYTRFSIFRHSGG